MRSLRPRRRCVRRIVAVALKVVVTVRHLYSVFGHAQQAKLTAIFVRRRTQIKVPRCHNFQRDRHDPPRDVKPRTNHNPSTQCLRIMQQNLPRFSLRGGQSHYTVFDGKPPVTIAAPSLFIVTLLFYHETWSTKKRYHQRSAIDNR